MPDPNTENEEPQNAETPVLGGGAYEIIRNRLLEEGKSLRGRMEKLNAERQSVFGAVEANLLTTERVTTQNNCIPRDMVVLPGNQFIFGYNVTMGLKSQVAVEDVFAGYHFDNSDHTFHECTLDFLKNEEFVTDFSYFYRYYKETTFLKFMRIGPYLHMAFRISKDIRDIKTLKWLVEETGLVYQGNRSEHEYQFPPQHGFEWTRAHRDMQRSGRFPHISIEDRLFVETTGGDLTIKIEDNTESGQGIYAEPVDEKDQTLDDADVFYASLGSLILLKITPYQEKITRYFVYNEKVREVRRVDSIGHSCVLLPDDHGIIFSNGYYLHNGDFKFFENDLSEMLFCRLVKSPNGEDYFYSFYNRTSGTYVLMSYNLIEQKVETPIVCHGFSIFNDGELVYFKTEDEPQKHHALQVWQTPYSTDIQQVEGQSDSFLYKIGNADVVRCMAECQEIVNLIQRDDSYAGLYLDLVKKSGSVVDRWFWIDKAEAFDLRTPLNGIKEAAQAAIEEFEKVVRIRKSTTERTTEVEQKSRSLFAEVESAAFETIVEYVHLLGQLRVMRGEIISLRDLRYIDLVLCEGLEEKAGSFYQMLAEKAVAFLLEPEALQPYVDGVAEQRAAIESVQKVTEADDIETNLSESGHELEMLIDVVSNLDIADSTQTTRIIDSISTIYSNLNQVRVELKNKRKALMRTEGVAQFGAQMKLLNQAVVNYLEISHSPESCDEYLTKVMIQLEELEGRYSEFDEFVAELGEKRTELYNAFESKKSNLQESRDKRVNQLLASADRILKGIDNRVKSFATVNEINGYFAADLMVDKIRKIIKQLGELGEPLKGDDLLTRLKTGQGDAIRQLKDKQELFVDGENIIQFGKHKFTVNNQELKLTMVQRAEDWYFHLTGTQFFEQVTDSAFLNTRSVWSMDCVSESEVVCRAEYLAYSFFTHLQKQKGITGFVELSEAEQSETLQKYMAPRYQEAYSKGLHDHDALIILKKLLEVHQQIGLLRYETKARALALVYWHTFKQEQVDEEPAVLAMKLESFGDMLRLFPQYSTQEEYIVEIAKGLSAFIEEHEIETEVNPRQSAAYLFHELVDSPAIVVSQEAATLIQQFEHALSAKRQAKRFVELRASLQGATLSEYQVIRDWLKGYCLAEGLVAEQEYLDEAAAHLLRGGFGKREVLEVSVSSDLEGLLSNHAVVAEGHYSFHYNRFIEKLANHEEAIVPLYLDYDRRKKELIAETERTLRLNEFKPRVLSSFVRNRLLDTVYLPLIGDNLAKQMGTVGDDSRTDRMGLLLLISPPGYGKTTLMEYVANRLGVTFVKVNGPALGHDVVSLDPAQASNASAREEVEKVNLAFEMGDNAMIYLDDIQHCNPEFLQKFISLCDGQRKIEGVYRGEAKTYDLRGKKIAVVMAGNPYTETGGKFQIPDMLANRADTYNLGDIIGSSQAAFEASYIENSLTSNAVLSQLTNKPRKDVYALMQIAETGSQEGVDFEGSYAAEEIEEMVSVMKKMMRVRDTILRVNLQYIDSASQADEYRTEPAFKLQGSYRNMNRIAEKILAIMSDDEIEQLIRDHYENESQTLTDGAEANMLKFYEIEEQLTEASAQRWEEIKKRFVKNQLLGGSGETDPVNRVVAQLSDFSDGLESISKVIQEGSQKSAAPLELSASSLDQLSEIIQLLGAREEQEAKEQSSIEAQLGQIAEALTAQAKKRTKGSTKIELSPKSHEQLENILSAFNRLFKHTGIEAIGAPPSEGSE